MQTTKRRMSQKEQVAGILARATPPTTSNQWGGTDYRGKVGMARTAVDDGQTTVLCFANHVELLTWQASFSSATPVAVVEATYAAAKRQADGCK